MKTLIASVLLTASIAISSASFAQSTAGVTAAANQVEVAKLFVENVNTGKIDVLVFKSEPKNATVALLDQHGNTLAIKSIARKTTATRTRFDLNALPDGAYKVILLEGGNKIVKDIILNTQTKETVRTVSVS